MKIKKVILFLLIIFVSISLTGCKNTQEEVSGNQDESKIINCLINKLDKYIKSEENKISEITQNTFTDKNLKIAYYKGAYTNDKNMYAIVKSNDLDVIRDFDLYFSNKYDTYQTFLIGDNINVYIHTELNNINLNDLSNCFVLNNELVESNGKVIDSKTIKSLNKTDKIVIKLGDKKIGVLKNKEVVKEILNIISSAKQYGDVFLCDGHGFNFEMYNTEGDLIDNIYVWADGNRLIPESIHSGCSYYVVSDNFIDLKELIERETDYVFYNLYSLSDSCDEFELIYEDELYNYYFNCKDFGKVLIQFNLTGLKMNIKYAIDNNYISIDQIYDDEMIIKKEK